MKSQPNDGASSPAELHQRLVQLEEWFTHEERKVQQLNQVILELHSHIDGLQKRMASLEHRLQWVAENSPANENLPHEKPPHY